MKLPRSAKQILDRADELAARFAQYEPDGREAAALRTIRTAFHARAEAERRFSDAVAAARDEGHSWASIGAMAGTSGEAARQRYGRGITNP